MVNGCPAEAGQFFNGFARQEEINRLVLLNRSKGPALDYNALLSIPVIDDPRIVSIMQVAYAEKRKLETQATKLLGSLDAVLFQALNIKIPAAPTNTVISRIFTVKQSALSGWRFDPAYFEVRLSVLRQAIRDGKNKLMPLGKVCAFLSNGRTPAADEYSDNPTTFPVIKVASYQNELIDLKKVAYATCQQTFAVQKGDVFILSAAHQPDYVGRFVKQLDDEQQTPTSFVGELMAEATVKNYLTVQREGKREVQRQIEYYNLDMVISVGYRVKSLIATCRDIEPDRAAGLCVSLWVR